MFDNYMLCDRDRITNEKIREELEYKRGVS